MHSNDFESLALAHRDAVYRQLVRLCHNRDDAEDLLIDALMKAYQSIEQLREPESFQAWLVQIARRSYHRMKRRESLHPVLSLDGMEHFSTNLPSVEEPPDETAIQEEFEQFLSQAVGELPDIYREVYMLHEVEELTSHEIAGKLGLSVPAVKSRIHRARELVRQRMDGMLHRNGGSKDAAK